MGAPALCVSHDIGFMCVTSELLLPYHRSCYFTTHMLAGIAVSQKPRWAGADCPAGTASSTAAADGDDDPRDDCAVFSGLERRN